MSDSFLNRLTSVLSHIDRSRPKVVVTRNLGPDVMPLFKQRSDIELLVWPEQSKCDPKWLLNNIPGASALLVMVTDKAPGPNLRIVSTMSVGYEHISVPELSKRGIKLGYTPDVLSDAVADLSVMLALMAGRNIRETMAVVNEGKESLTFQALWPAYPWAPYLFCGPQLSASAASPRRTVGFLGFGRISQATLARLIPFGITDCVYSSSPSSKPTLERDTALQQRYNLHSLKRVDLDELAKQSDVLFVLAPGGEATYHLVNEEFLRKMKKTSVLVNTSRGSLVDSDALAKALREQWIWGAGIDVVEGEPQITDDHPLVKEPRCSILPHIGSGTLETRVGMATLAVKNILACLNGEALPASLDLDGGSR
ncbi:hypothetical protein BDQ12DRAFT_765206 [Crucibulum laeve]|uniref:D-isomer specific 2-hydroxyacid dehydrogenase n=1 Tax=Crucibulum laeve TaxID=68775 RepID=A0A5C3M8A5_9AGAR|nr:hypothetical protein BDQ12DRAFT_765206 [Crucibulum laeve]